MPFHFCPQCGTKLQDAFRFCPSCGEKLPSPVEPSPGPAGTTGSPLKRTVQLHTMSLAASNTSCASQQTLVSVTPVVVSPRPPLGTTHRSVLLAKPEKSPTKDTAPLQGTHALPGAKRVGAVSPLRARTLAAFKRKEEMESPEATLAKKPPTPGKGKGRLRRVNEVEEEEQQTSRAEQEKEPVDLHSPAVPPSPGSPFSKASPGGRGKSKKAKRASAVQLLGEEEELTDTVGRKWRPGRLLSQTTTDLIYEAFAANSKDSKHILKLGAKDGRIFNEQNFLQRAAKASSVEKWMKSNKLNFLGIPSCVGFGLHADLYRFLVFPSMGRNLQSILESRGTLLSETVVLQLACRIIDVLKYIHSNEYVHGNITAENIYIGTEGQSQVFLAGYAHAFRYCPGGQHVEYREASRTPHEGALEHISVDSHKGVGPSQRSDLQSLGYCMLHWHTGLLPWATHTDPQLIGREKQRFMEDVPALLSDCFGKKRVSSAMQQYLTRVMALGYADTPDYAALKTGLHDALSQLGGAMEQPLSF